MPDVLRRFRRDIAVLGSSDCSVEDKVEILYNFCHLAGFGDHMHAFVTAQGIRVLVHISTAEWPEDGDLRSSKSVYDKDALLKEERVERQSMVRYFAACERETYHSMRRVAIGCLGEMCNYPQYIQALITDNFYTHLPKMLRDTVKAYKFGQSYDDMYGSKAGATTDHAQFILERLVNILAGTFSALTTLGNRPIFDFICEKCIPEIAARVDILQYERRADMQQGLAMDPFVETFDRCVYNMLGVASQMPLTPAAKLALFSSCLGARIVNLPNFGARGSVSYAALQRQYAEVAEKVHLPGLCAEMQRMRLASTALCEQASARFAASNFKAALESYRGALQTYPWSSEGAAGVAAAMLGSRKPKKALDAAFMAVQHNPRWAAGWVRLAEAMLALGDPQKARRCIEISRKLAPQTPDAFDMAALKEATPAPSDAYTNSPLHTTTLHNLSMLALAAERVRAVPTSMRNWVISAATFGQTGPIVKAPVYMMSFMSMDDGSMLDQECCEGLPSPELIQCVLLRTMAYHQAVRPGRVLVAFRLAYAWPLLKTLATTLGGGLTFQLESKYEAELSATRNDTDYLGFNGDGSGRRVYTRLMLADV